MCCHPDDPPFDLLGLPRIMSTEAHYRAMMEAVDLPANGITLCSGSLGARPDNDLPAMMRRLGDRVHFLHLRNVKRDTAEVRGSFFEAEHLGGDTDMVAVLAAALAEEARRKAQGRADWSRWLPPSSTKRHAVALPGAPTIRSRSAPTTARTSSTTFTAAPSRVILRSAG